VDSQKTSELCLLALRQSDLYLVVTGVIRASVPESASGRGKDVPRQLQCSSKQHTRMNQYNTDSSPEVEITVTLSLQLFDSMVVLERAKHFACTSLGAAFQQSWAGLAFQAR